MSIASRREARHRAHIAALELRTGQRSPGNCAECGLPVEPLTAPYDSGRYFCGGCQVLRRLGDRDSEGEP